MAIAMVSIFKNETEEVVSSVEDDTADYRVNAMFLVIIWAVTATISISMGILTLKWLMIRHNVPGDTSGLFFMLTEGVLGSICLAIFSASGKGIQTLEPSSIGMLALSAVFNFSAIVIANYSCASGIAGVAISIMSTNSSLQCVLSSVFLK